MKQMALVLVLCVLMAGCNESGIMSTSSLSIQGQQSKFFEKEIVKKAELGFWLYLPEDYGTPGKEPQPWISLTLILILFVMVTSFSAIYFGIIRKRISRLRKTV